MMLEPIDLLAIYVVGFLAMLGMVAWASYRVDAEVEELGIEDKTSLRRRIASNLTMVGIVVLWPLAMIALPLMANRLYEKIRSDDGE